MPECCHLLGRADRDPQPALGADLGAIAGELQTLTPTVVQPGYATGTTVRMRDGVAEGVVVHFLRDADGVWRIAGL